MFRILFVAEGVSLAHVARPVALAAALRESDCEIHFACAERFGVCFRGIEWPVHRIGSIEPRLFMQRLARGAPLYRLSELTEYVEADLRLLNEIRPDVVVGDFRLSLSVSARVANIPYVAVCNAHWSPWADIGRFPCPDMWLTRAFGPWLANALFQLGRPVAFRFHAAPLNTLRRAHGLASLRDVRSAYTDGDLVLLADPPALVPTRELPSTHRFIGPIVWSPSVDTPPWWDNIPPKPLAYVTLGSTGHVDLVPLVLTTLEDMGFGTIVATAGRVDIASIAGRRWVATYLPGEEAARRSTLVVCNGGSATAYQALAVGRPVLGLCSNMDQFLTMQCIGRVGAGLSMRASTVGSRALQSAIRRIRDEDSFRCAARKLQEQIGRFPYREKFREALAQIGV